MIMLDTCEVVVRMAASSLRVPKDFSTRRSCGGGGREREGGEGERGVEVEVSEKERKKEAIESARSSTLFSLARVVERKTD